MARNTRRRSEGGLRLNLTNARTDRLLAGPEPESQAQKRTTALRKSAARLIGHTTGFNPDTPVEGHAYLDHSRKRLLAALAQGHVAEGGHGE